MGRSLSKRRRPHSAINGQPVSVACSEVLSRDKNVGTLALGTVARMAIRTVNDGVWDLACAE